MITQHSLGNGIIINIDEKNRFTTYSVLLADFSAPHKNDTAADLCSGTGIIPLLWYRRFPELKVLGIEIQSEACELIKKSIRENNLNEKFNVINADLRDLKGKVEPNSFSLVSCNPPYMPALTGRQSICNVRKIARHEISCNFFEIAKAAGYMLKYSGRFCFCHKPERLTDCFEALRQAGMEPKKLMLVKYSAEREPWLALIEARKGGRPSLRVMPDLVFKNSDGSFTQKIKQIYSFENI